MESVYERGQQAQELALVVRRQAGEQVSEQLAQTLAHGVQRLAPRCAQADEHTAAVGSFAAPLGEAGALEAIDQPGDGAGRETESMGELVHAHIAAGEHRQGLQLHGGDAPGNPAVATE